MVTFLYCCAAFILGCIVGGAVISKLDWYAFKATIEEGEKKDNVITHVYIAGPMNSSGRLMANVREACRVATILRLEGFKVYLPHLNVLWDLTEPAPDHFWLANDLAWIDRSDALLRLPGESKGGDLEVAHALAGGVKVYDARELGTTANAVRALLRDRDAERTVGKDKDLVIAEQKKSIGLLESTLSEKVTILDAVERALTGQPVSDFEESFPLVALALEKGRPHAD